MTTDSSLSRGQQPTRRARGASEDPSLLANPPPGTRLARIREFIEGLGEPPYRFRQLVGAVRRGAVAFDDVHELPRTLRRQLTERFGADVLPLRPVGVVSGEQVDKVLFEMERGARVETVHARYRSGWSSLCVSSQAGCGLGCSFCATGAMGLLRNLTAEEILGQILHPVWRRDGQRPPTSISFMGMGEALANPHTFPALKLLTDRQLGGFSPRRVTVSTVGFAPNLERLVKEHPQVTVTLSVHSPFPLQRRQLIPLQELYPLDENLALLDEHVIRVRRKTYLAYLLIAGVNDSHRHLRALTELVRARSRPELFHVSVIPYNPATGADPSFRAPAIEHVVRFVRDLRQHGVHATRRRQLGTAVDAACGQLHARYLTVSPTSGRSPVN